MCEGIKRPQEKLLRGRAEIKNLKAPFSLQSALQSGTYQTEFAERSSQVDCWNMGLEPREILMAVEDFSSHSRVENSEQKVALGETGCERERAESETEDQAYI